MIKVKAKVRIPAPPSEVFSFLCDPYRMALTNVSYKLDEVTDLPGGMRGTRLKSTRPDGVVMNVESETIEGIPDSKVVIRSRISPYRGGHMEMLVTRTLDPVPEGTLLTSIRECRVRPWYMGHIASAREYVAMRSELQRGVYRIRDTIVRTSGQQPVATERDSAERPDY